ncbi:MAG: hypothetical protein Tsb0013_14620 [Phycisphaerales bacterium]
MGFLSSIGKMFSASDPQRRAKPSPNGRRTASPARTGTEPEGGGVAVLDQATALREHVEREERRRAQEQASTSEAPTASVEVESVPEQEASIAPPRNKQELFEELQRNYRDVVDLVKKVDAHLDRNERRAQEMLSIAQRIDETLPTIEQFPGMVRQQLDELKTEVVGAIEASSAKGDARGAQLQQTLSTIGERIDSTSASHTQLVATMAGFRETLGELAHHSSRTSEVLESIDTRRQQREDELTKMLIASRRWSVVTLAVTLLGVSAATAIAIVALVMRA